MQCEFSLSLKIAPTAGSWLEDRRKFRSTQLKQSIKVTMEAIKPAQQRTQTPDFVSQRMHPKQTTVELCTVPRNTNMTCS